MAQRYGEGERARAELIFLIRIFLISTWLCQNVDQTYTLYEDDGKIDEDDDLDNPLSAK